MRNINCPLCGLEIKKAGKTLFCKCGWSKSCNEKLQKLIQKKIAKNIFLAGLGLMGGIIYLSYWGSASIKIIPLKVSEWTGQLNEKSFSSLKNICMNLKKYDCVENAHKSFFKSSGKMEILEQLGDFQYRRKKFSQASNTYNRYFSQKGNSVKAAYNYARILEEMGDTGSALSYYRYALKARPGVIQITVMRSYIDLLVKSGQKYKAKQELLKLKPILKRADSLVKQEYNRWKKQVI